MKEAGAKRAMPLPVSAPFHTALLRPAGEQMKLALAEVSFAAPTIQVVHNVHAQCEPDPQRIRSLMVEQIYSPVLWTSCVQTMLEKGIATVVECGPGKVLSGLNRRIDKSLKSYSLEEADSLATVMADIAG